MKTNAIEAVTMMEKYLPSDVLTIQVHLLLHVVDEVAVAGTVHSRWMFFLERFMKTLKGFVRQRARPEGSMAMGWLVQESLVYITEFLITTGSNMPQLWKLEEDDKNLEDEPQGNGQVKVLSVSMREKINKFCILNSTPMEKWLQKYEEAKVQRNEARRRFRQSRTTARLPYPPDLVQLPDFPSGKWLDDAIREAKLAGQHISEEEEELATGCDFHVSAILPKFICQILCFIYLCYLQKYTYMQPCVCELVS